MTTIRDFNIQPWKIGVVISTYYLKNGMLSYYEIYRMYNSLSTHDSKR